LKARATLFNNQATAATESPTDQFASTSSAKKKGEFTLMTKIMIKRIRFLNLVLGHCNYAYDSESCWKIFEGQTAAGDLEEIKQLRAHIGGAAASSAASETSLPKLLLYLFKISPKREKRPVQRVRPATRAASFSTPSACSRLSQLRKWLCGTRKVGRKVDNRAEIPGMHAPAPQVRPQSVELRSVWGGFSTRSCTAALRSWLGS